MRKICFNNTTNPRRSEVVFEEYELLVMDGAIFWGFFYFDDDLTQGNHSAGGRKVRYHFVG